jgi:hypothetical protein
MLKMENGINSDARELLQIREQIAHHQKSLNELKKIEKMCIKNIQAYLNENDESGIKIDEDVVIVLSTRPRKIPMTKSEYQEYLEKILSRPENYEEVKVLIQQILDKTSDTVQEQKLNIVKKYKK